MEIKLKKIFLFILIVMPFLSKAALWETPLINEEQLRERVVFFRNASRTEIVSIEQPKGVIALRDLFIEKVKEFEKAHNRPMQVYDLVKPYVHTNNRHEIYIPEIRQLDVFGIGNPDTTPELSWETLKEQIYPWFVIHECYSRFRSLNYYDFLFCSQMTLELIRLGYNYYINSSSYHPGFHITRGDFNRGLSFLLNTESTGTFLQRLCFSRPAYKKRLITLKRGPYPHYRTKTRKDYHKYYVRMFVEGKKEPIDSKPPQKEIKIKDKEVYLYTETPMLESENPSQRYEELPKLNEEVDKLEDVEAIGFSVFMHGFKPLRDQIADYDSYGMKKGLRKFKISEEGEYAVEDVSKSISGFQPFSERSKKPLIPERKGEEEGKIVELGDASGAATGGAATGGASDREGLRYRGKGSASRAGESAGIGLREEGVVLAKASSPGSSAAAKAEESMGAGAASRPASPVDEEENKPLLASEEDGNL